MPQLSLGCRNASFHVGLSSFTPMTWYPASASASTVPAKSGVLNVKWCAPGPLRAKKRRRNSLPSPGIGSRISTRVPPSNATWQK